MLELWGMRSTPSVPSLSGPHWTGVVASDRVLSMSQIEVKWVLKTAWQIELSEIELLDHFIVRKEITDV